VGDDVANAQSGAKTTTPTTARIGGAVVVTGASKGIGAAIVVELERRGFTVFGLSRSGESPGANGLVCDVTDEQAVRAAFAAIAERGPIKGLVNNAGLHRGGPSQRLVTADFDAVMALNVTAVMACSREVYPYLETSGGGRIVNLGSFFDRMGVPHNLAYCASKAAVAAMTRCLAVEWARKGISVVNVAPGYVATDFNSDYLTRPEVKAWMAERVPWEGRPGTVDEVGRLVASLFVEDIPYLTGETIYMDGAHGINH
jgi:NAD(P)-dependent dehydrogenase (short-subunit alcohol dehydrogenase family)